MLCKNTTTREFLKNIDVDPNEEPENQWCGVDPPLIDLNEELTQDEAKSLVEQLEEIAERNKPPSNFNQHPQYPTNNNPLN